MDEQLSPQLLDLISNEREWHHQHTNRGSRGEGGGGKKSSEERKLELSLAPPGAEEDWSLNHKTNAERGHSLLSLSYNFPHANSNNNGFQTHNNMSSAWPSTTTGYHHQNQQQGNSNKASSSFLQFPSSSPPPPPPSSQPQSSSSSMPVMGKDASQACCTKVAELQSAEKNVFSSPSSANTAVPNTNTSQKRTAPGPVVGWPPIRSFRKNLASSSSSKPAPPESPQHHQPNKLLSGKKPVDNNYGKGMFVKINMDGVPIGRKVDLNAYDSYENLSTAVDELFRGLLAAQRDSSAGGVHNKQGEEKPITGLLDGSGEYTLVYEDNEGDRMLVGDVPWHMFVSTVKRLRVLKSTELSAFTLGGKQDKDTT